MLGIVLFSVLIYWSHANSRVDELLGVKLAFPQSALTIREGDSLFRCTEDEYYSLRVSIDASGALTGITAKDVISGIRLQELKQFFEQSRYLAGKRGDKSVPQILPTTIYLFADRRPPAVTFPVGTNGQIEDASLFWRAVELNGVTTPRLERFPSFHSTLSGADTMSSLRYVLVSVQLDREGLPTDISLAHANYDTFVEQVLTAVNWAKYTPARIDSQVVSSSGFLLVSFFPSVQYPTRVLKIGSPDTALTLERLAIRYLPDTLGLLSGPIPRFAKNWTYPVAVKPGAWRQKGIFRYKIDNRGVPWLVSGGNGSAAAVQFGSSLGASMRFYPALDNWGRPVPFEGVVKVEPEGASNVRVRFLWLQ